jgi:hypothetical protein
MLGMSIDNHTALSRAQAIEIVTALYRSVLEREPDAKGLAAHVETLLRRQSLDASGLLASFLNSEERAALVHSQILNSELRFVAEKNPPLAVPQLISLGAHCYTAYMLKRAGLKSASYPFDWIFSSPQMVRDIIEDDFDTFMNPKYFRPVSENQGKSCDHIYYLERYGIKSIFNHSNPTLPSDYAYLRRTVDRFRAQLNGSSPLVFVCTFRSSRAALDGFLCLRTYLLKTNPDIQCLGVAISNDAPPNDPSDNTFGTSDGVIPFVATSEWLDLRFASMFDDARLFGLVVAAVCERFGKAALA